jgi:putative oxidoreductase
MTPTAHEALSVVPRRARPMPCHRTREMMRAKIEKFTGFWSNWTPSVLSLLRIMSALLLLQHGTSKILKFPHNPNYDNIKVFSLIWFAGMLELVFGSLLTVGLFTRIAAFVLSGEMAFAYFMGHFPRHFIPILNNGNLAVLYCFVFFYLAFAGPGPWSIDQMRKHA